MEHEMRRLINQVRNFGSKTINENINQKDRLTALENFFRQGGTGREQKWIRDFYIHFKNGGDIDNLESQLKNVYLKSPGIFNFSSFSKEQYIELIENLAKITNDETFLEEPNFGF
jgi:hypothetical protein